MEDFRQDFNRGANYEANDLNGPHSQGGTVRLTGGFLRGRRIATPGGPTHPMGERERLALFNMLGDRVNGAAVLDVYSGGGTLAFEALSRGAKFVLCLDKSQRALGVARDTFRRLKIPRESWETIVIDVAKYKAIKQYDIVFADPPYDKYTENMVSELPKFVKNGGILVISHPGEAPKLTDMKMLRSRQYAGANLSIFEKYT